MQWGLVGMGVWEKDSGSQWTLGLLPSIGHGNSIAVNMGVHWLFLSKQVFSFL